MLFATHAASSPSSTTTSRPTSPSTSGTPTPKRGTSSSPNDHPTQNTSTRKHSPSSSPDAASSAQHPSSSGAPITAVPRPGHEPQPTDRSAPQIGVRVHERVADRSRQKGIHIRCSGREDRPASGRLVTIRNAGSRAGRAAAGPPAGASRARCDTGVRSVRGERVSVIPVCERTGCRRGRVGGLARRL